MSRLHFGCFNYPQDGWINTDVTPHLWIARVPGLAWTIHKLGKMSDDRMAEHKRGIFRRVRYLNVTKSWPYPANSLDAVYSSHVLEHLPLHGAKKCLAEAYRCIEPGGGYPDFSA